MNPQAQTELNQSIERLNTLLERMPVEGTNSAAQVLFSLVPIIGIIFGCTVLFFFFYWRFKVQAQLINSGLFQYRFARQLRILTLLIGSLSSMVGVALTGLFAALEGASYVLLGGLIPLACGLGLLLFYWLSRRREADEQKSQTFTPPTPEDRAQG